MQEQYLHAALYLSPATGANQSTFVHYSQFFSTCTRSDNETFVDNSHQKATKTLSLSFYQLQKINLSMVHLFFQMMQRRFSGLLKLITIVTINI